MPGMLMSDRIRISDGSLISAARASAVGRRRRELHVKRPDLQIAPELLTKQRLDIGLVIDDEYVNAQLLPPVFCARSVLDHVLTCAAPVRGNVIMNSVNTPGSVSTSICAAMLFHDDVVAHRQAKPGALARRLGGEEGIEHFLLHFQRDTRAVVADPDFHLVAEALCRGAQRRLEALLAGLLALVRGIEAVRNQVEEHPRDLLRIKIDHAGRGIEVALAA